MRPRRVPAGIAVARCARGTYETPRLSIRSSSPGCPLTNSSQCRAHHADADLTFTGLAGGPLPPRPCRRPARSTTCLRAATQSDFIFALGLSKRGGYYAASLTGLSLRRDLHDVGLWRGSRGGGPDPCDVRSRDGRVQ